MKQIFFGTTLLLGAIPAIASRAPAIFQTPRSFVRRQQTVEAYEVQKVKNLSRAVAICESLSDGRGSPCTAGEICDLYRVMFANFNNHFDLRTQRDVNACVDLQELHNVWDLIFTLAGTQGLKFERPALR